MAQVGRISGPLLAENLLRNGSDLRFRNDINDDPLLYLDVNGNQIGVNVSFPSNDLQVSGTTQTTDLIGSSITTPRYTIVNDINIDVGDIELYASEEINFSSLEIDNFYFNSDKIVTTNQDGNLILNPAGTGSVEILSNLNVTGSIYTTGNITLEGNITFGNESTDTINFNADINSDIVSDLDNSFNLGSSERRWSEVHTNLVNGASLNTTSLAINSIDFTLTQGQKFYVSQNGSDSNFGDNLFSPFRTIKHALSVIDSSSQGPVTVFVYPGIYEEQTPLNVPDNVSVIGVDIRNCIVKPATSYETNDVFKLNDASYIANLTIRDFNYDSNLDTGYAFRFDSNALLITKSPYIQDITVITSESTPGVSGDAGRGARIDGAEVNSSSLQPSLLFHSSTFITPNADCIVMTNGVRVEWLNSFTYYANRGLYAVDGTAGHLSIDGSTINYGAELRSIGSANVYGNIGAEADGADCLMYLINHNFAYIGSGTDSTNDNSLVIQANETVEKNSGKVHYVSTDHTGAFRVGDSFLVDFETGDTTLTIADPLLLTTLTSLNVTTGASTTVITGANIETGVLRIDGNEIITLADDLVIDSVNDINLLNNVNILENLTVNGNTTVGGTVIRLGDQPTDTVTFEMGFDQDIEPKDTYTFDLGTSIKRWNNLYIKNILTDDIRIQENFITTTLSNSDLDLRANGSGNVTFSSVRAEQDFEATSNTILESNVNFNNLILNGNKIQTGNYEVSGELTIDSVYIEDNFITTTSGDLILETTGNVIIDTNNVLVENSTLTSSLTVDGSTTLQPTYITGTLNHTGNNIKTVGNLNLLGELTVDNVYIEDNFITTTSGNLILGATGDINVDTNDVEIAQDLTVSGDTSLQKIVTVEEDSFITLSSTLDNPNAYGTGEFDLFGHSVAISGNYAIVGAYGEHDAGGIASGKAYIYNTTTGTLLHTLDNPNAFGTSENDFFGWSVAISGNRAIVGAYQEDETEGFSSGNNSGKAYIFDVTTGNLLHTLDNPNAFGTSDFDRFGYSVAISGNYAIVGAYQEDDADNIASGKAYIFDVVTGNLLHTLDNPNAYNIIAGGDNFGDAVAISGNYAIVSAVFEDDAGGLASGKAYIFDVTTGSLLQTIDNPNAYGTSQLDTFGNSVAISGDRAIVGARNEDDDGGSVSGKAYIFDVTTGNLLHTLDNPNAYDTSASDEFGWSVAISGNYAIVGARMEDDAGGSNSGKAYIFDVTTGNLLYTLDNPNAYDTSAGDQFGWSVAISGDYAIVGAYVEGDAGGIASGKSYIFEIVNPPSTILSPVDVNITGTLTQAGDRTQTGNYNNAGEISNGNILIEDNFITTTNTNSDLELRANGTGVVLIPNNDLVIANNLHNNQNTEILSTFITGTVNSSNIDQIGNLSITGDYQTDSLTVNRRLILSEILIDDNFITTTSSNADLELRANGTGNVLINDTVEQPNSITVQGSTTFNNAVIQTSISSNSLTTDTYNITGNVITNSLTDQNIVLEANGTGSIIITTDAINVDGDIISVSGTTNLLNTDITGNISHVGTTSRIGNITLVGNSSISGILEVNSDAQFENISIIDNVVQTNDSNSDLELRTTGAGVVRISKLTVANNVNVSGFTTNNIDLATNLENSQFSTTSIDIFQNVIDTISNADLELAATKNINVDSNDFKADQNFEVVGSSEFNKSLSTDDIIQTGDTVIRTVVRNNPKLNLEHPFAVVAKEIEQNTVFPDFSFNNLTEWLVEGTTAPYGNSRVDIRQDNLVNSLDAQDWEYYFIGANLSLEKRNFADRVLKDFQEEWLSKPEGYYEEGSTTEPFFTILEDTVVKTDSLAATNLILQGDVQFEDINISDNVITTTSSNSNLEIAAVGTGKITINNQVEVAQNVTAGSITVNNIVLTGTADINNMFVPIDIEIFDNVITTLTSNSNLELRTNDPNSNVSMENIFIQDNKIFTSINDLTLQTNYLEITSSNAIEIPKSASLTSSTTGDITFNTDTSVFEGFGYTNKRVDLEGVRSSDNNTSLTTDDNEIQLTVNGITTTTFDGLSTIETNEFSTNGLITQGTTINTTTNVSLIGNGTGSVLLEDFDFNSNSITYDNGNLTLLSSDSGFVKFKGTGAVRFPIGGNLTRESNPEVGMIRYNTDRGFAEVWDGQSWSSAAGDTTTTVTEEFMNELLDLYTLVFA